MIKLWHTQRIKTAKHYDRQKKKEKNKTIKKKKKKILKQLEIIKAKL